MQKIYMAFGDKHFCDRLVERTIGISEELNATAIFLGVYVNRSQVSIKVLEVLINAWEKHSFWIFLRGNHEQMLLDLINGQRQPECYDECTEKESYAEWENAASDFKAKVVEFLNETLLYFETNQIILVHAPLRNTKTALHLKNTGELIWNYDLEPQWSGEPFIHGHLPIDEASTFGNGININTNYGYEGKLTGSLVDLNAAMPQ